MSHNRRFGDAERSRHNNHHHQQHHHHHHHNYIQQRHRQIQLHQHQHNNNNHNHNNDILDDMFSTLPTLEQVRRASKEDLLRHYSCGCTPLRHAVKHGASIQVVRLLLEKAPEAMERKNSHGNVVLSHVKNTTVPEVGLLIAQLTSDFSLLQLDLDGDYPLHCLLQNRASDAVIETTVDRCPSVVFSHVNNTKRSALHEAIVHGASINVVQKIVQRCPKALHKTDADGKLPLHWIGHWTPQTVAEYLLAESQSTAFYTRDKEGRVPLHTAIQSIAAVPVLDHMLRWSSNRDSQHTLAPTDDTGYAGDARIRTAGSDAVDADIRNLLLQMSSTTTPASTAATNADTSLASTGSFVSHPGGTGTDKDCCSTYIPARSGDPVVAAGILAQSDRYGRLPVHMVLDYSASDIVWKNTLLKLIIRQCPASVWKSKDYKGRLPIHCLRFVSRLDGTVLRDMTERSGPGALLEQDHRGRTPLHVALEDPHVTIPTVQQLLGKKTDGTDSFCDGAKRSTSPYPVLDVVTSEGHLPIHTAALFQTNQDIVRFLLEQAGPDQAHSIRRRKDSQGCVPVHLAVQRRHARPSVGLVDMLLGDDDGDETLLGPDAASDARIAPHPLITQDESGQLPIHCGICFRTSSDILRHLVSRTPGWAFDTADLRHRIPLRCALEASASAHIFKLILDKTPSSVFGTAENNGNLMLHYLPSSVSVDAVELLSERHPQLLLTRDGSGRLPIHRAIVRLASTRVLHSMIEHAPESLNVADAEGRLPIHLLPDSGHGLDHVHLLIERSGRRALMTPDRYGQLPLHRAVSEEMRPEIIKLLIDACPDALLEFDHDDKLPVHHVILPSTERASWRAKRRRGLRANLSDPTLSRWAQWQNELVLLLVSKNAQALQMKDHLGRLLLHRAAVHSSIIPAAIFQKLIEAYPDAIKVQDENGKLPLHYALEHWNGAQLTSMPLSLNYVPEDDSSNAVGFVENLQVLLNSFSGAIYVKDKQQMLPLHLAMLAGAPVDALYLLNKLAPDLLYVGGDVSEEENEDGDEVNCRGNEKKARIAEDSLNARM